MILSDLVNALQQFKFSNNEISKFKKQVWDSKTTVRLVAILWMNNIKEETLQLDTSRDDIKNIGKFLNQNANRHPQLGYATLGFIVQLAKEK